MIEGDDPEMRELAEAELPELQGEARNVWDELLDMTIGGEDATEPACVMEIRAGTGGDEAALFARDLFEMYKKHARDQGLESRDPRRQPDGTGRIQGDHRWRSKAKASFASCSTRAAATACSGCRKPKPRAGFTLRRPPWP